MEVSGFKIDRDELAKFGKMLGERIGALEGAIHFMSFQHPAQHTAGASQLFNGWMDDI